MSIPTRILEHIEGSGQKYTTGELAGQLDLPSKTVSSVLSKLIKSGKLVRFEDGRVGVPYVESQAEYDNWSQDQAAADLDEQAPHGQDVPSGPEKPSAEEFKAGDKTVDVASWKRKITAMLAKAERTENEHERDAFMKAAEKLMVRLGIHRAELEAVGEAQKEKIVEVSRVWRGNYSIVMLLFTYDVAMGFGDLTVLQATRSAVHRTSFIIGPKSQVEEFMVLINSLELQSLSALKRWQKETRVERADLTDMEKYIQHRSFLAGFGSMVSRRLLAIRKTEEQSMSTGAELVVADRRSDIQAWVDEQYPNVGKSRGGTKYSDAGSRMAGQEAGKKADLNQKKIDKLAELI